MVSCSLVRDSFVRPISIRFFVCRARSCTNNEYLCDIVKRNRRRSWLKLAERETCLQNLSRTTFVCSFVFFYPFSYFFYFCNYRTCLVLSDLLIFNKFVVFHKHSIVEDIQRTVAFFSTKLRFHSKSKRNCGK